MRIVKPSAVIETQVNGPAMLRRIERIGRVCYKTEDLITDASAEEFVKMILKRGHHSVIEHESVTARFICDRGITHEIVRHRLSSYSQESTRYCNYAKEKFGNEITFIDPSPFIKKLSPRWQHWEQAMVAAEQSYFTLLNDGGTAQMARSVLPNSLKTEIVMTANLREWRHFFTLRAAKPAHPQMRQVACPLLREFRERIPVLFDDVGDVDV